MYLESQAGSDPSFIWMCKKQTEKDDEGKKLAKQLNVLEQEGVPHESRSWSITRMFRTWDT